MKLLFASLLCHRDVQIFKFNWFCMRAHLDHGFDIPHLILNDGSLTQEDIKELCDLPRVIIEEDPITIYDVPKAVLLGKLECLKRGFEKYKAERVVVFDCDIFFYKNWDADLRKIVSERAVVMRDWGSSIGPNVDKFYQLYGVREDVATPNCNTGIISVLSEDYHLIDAALQKHFEDTFLIMEDQGIMVAAFHSKLSYVEGIKCVINNAENIPELWEWVLSQRGAHLMGMRTRPKGLKALVDYSIENLPRTIHLSQIEPSEKHISWGLMEYGTYNFNVGLQKIPSTCNGNYVTDALYLHGGSKVTWKLPKSINRFKASYVGCMDTGIIDNVPYVIVNGMNFARTGSIDITLDGELTIETLDGPGSHVAIFSPQLQIAMEEPILSHQHESFS